MYGDFAAADQEIELTRALDALDTADAGMVSRIREQRAKALAGLEREERELLGMRMRQLLTDDEFHRERATLHTRRRDLEERRDADTATAGAAEGRRAEVSGLLDLAHGLPLVLEKGDPVQMRGILQQLHLKITLRSRRLEFHVSEPLSRLVKAGSDSNWCATWPDIWKWIQFGEVDARDGMHAVDELAHAA